MSVGDAMRSKLTGAAEQVVPDGLLSVNESEVF